MNAPAAHLNAPRLDKEHQEIYRRLYRGLCRVRFLSRQISLLAGRDYDKITPLRKIHEQADQIHDLPKLLKNNLSSTAGVSVAESRRALGNGLTAIRQQTDAARSAYWDKEAMELLNDLTQIAKEMSLSFASILDTDQHAIET